MGPSEKSFNQVRSILGKLDRSIDEARAKRTQVPPPSVPAPKPIPVQNPSPSQQPAQNPVRPASTLMPSRPSPGRATPIPSTPMHPQRRPA